ncbi:hypothetical protein ABZ604_31515 [Streptomyces sp. NPDC012473]|uniref:hypothetical protein n=1 Tax=Streptomyces sp. NPDC012473 TaxID=3156676 RepID=UPI0033DC1B8B
MPYIDTFVCVDDEHIYPARLDRSNRWNGWVSPGFTLDAVRELAAHTEEAAEMYGPECVDQIAVIEGEPQPVVLHIRWAYFDRTSPASSVSVVKPDSDGLYWIGGWEWTWYEVEDGPLFHTQRTAHEAWKQVLTHSARRMGEILRAQLPDAASCLVDPSELGRIVHVFGAPGDDWQVATGAEEDWPVDAETLGEADEVLRRALEHGRAADALEISGWRPARDIKRPELHHVVFAPRGLTAVGDSPLEDARAKATEARRALLNETTPHLMDDAAAACHAAVGVIVDPTAEQPFLTFLTDAASPASAPVRLVQRVRDRLTDMFAYRPTADDLRACGWKAVTSPELDGAYALLFPTE